MKVKYFLRHDSETPDDFEKNINNFIFGKKVIDIKYQSNISYTADDGISGEDTLTTALVMYEDKPTVKVRYFNEDDYTDFSDTYARMGDAVNMFCKGHDVVSIKINQDSEERLITAVVYKE